MATKVSTTCKLGNKDSMKLNMADQHMRGMNHCHYDHKTDHNTNFPHPELCDQTWCLHTYTYTESFR